MKRSFSIKLLLAFPISILLIGPTLWAGDISASPSARYSGTYGVRFSVFDELNAYLQDLTPAAATRYRARFYANFENLVLGPSDRLDILTGASLSRPKFALTLINRSGDTGLTMSIALDGGGMLELPANEDVFYGPGYHLVEVDYLADSTNGHLHLWLDDVLVATLDGVATGEVVVEEANLGAINVPTPTMSGYFDVDDFMSDSSDYIGPLTCGAIYQYEFAFANWAAGQSIMGMIPYISNPCF